MLKGVHGLHSFMETIHYEDDVYSICTNIIDPLVMSKCQPAVNLFSNMFTSGEIHPPPPSNLKKGSSEEAKKWLT